MDTTPVSSDPDDPNFFPEAFAKLLKDSPVNYQKIKEAFDPYDIIKPGQPCTWNSVDYFHQAWGGQLREYNDADLDEPIYDVEDWLYLLCGVEHGAFYMRKFCAPDGFFMTNMAEEVFLRWISADQTPRWDDKRRWVGTMTGLRAVAIELCSQRKRPGLDYKRINMHACYLAETAVLMMHMKYNEPLRAAIQEFMNGQQLGVWENAVNDLPLDQLPPD